MPYWIKREGKDKKDKKDKNGGGEKGDPYGPSPRDLICVFVVLGKKKKKKV